MCLCECVRLISDAIFNWAIKLTKKVTTMPSWLGRTHSLSAVSWTIQWTSGSCLELLTGVRMNTLFWCLCLLGIRWIVRCVSDAFWQISVIFYTNLNLLNRHHIYLEYTTQWHWCCGLALSWRTSSISSREGVLRRRLRRGDLKSAPTHHVCFRLSGS